MMRKIPPKCKCGCGNQVTKLHGKWNTYVHGHNCRGITLSIEHKRKIGLANKNVEHKKLSEELKKKLSIIAFDRNPIGKHNNCWKGGIAPYGSYWRKMSKEIKKRDNYACKKCGKIMKFNKVQVHHINRIKKDNNPKNLITLCKSCHIKEHPHSWFLKKIQNKACIMFMEQISYVE